MDSQDKHITRFLKRVKKTPGCWEWLASKTTGGYGRFKVGTRDVGAHRFSYTIHKGTIPSGAYVCHSCDNPWCVNPDHLWLGSQADNIKDMCLKGHQGKLTASTVQQIREESKKEGPSVLARRYGVTRQTIWRVVTKRAWYHLG